MIVRGEAELAKFRREYLNGDYLRELMRAAEARTVAVNLPVGSGKSTAIDALVETTVVKMLYDLVICLAPTHNILRERRWVKDPPREVKVAVLHPRPQERCGAMRNQDWASFEKAGCYKLGKRDICVSCPEYGRCHWPDQLTKGIEGAQVIFGAQAHLSRADDFIRFLVKRLNPERPLVILDEDHAILTSQRRKIGPAALAQYHAVLSGLGAECPDSHLYQTGLLRSASTTDLRSHDWHFPLLDGSEHIRIQDAGYTTLGAQFRDLTFLLNAFERSPLTSRDKNGAGEILFATPPLIEPDLFLFTASRQKRLLEFRLGRKLYAPFKDIVFIHPGTKFYNLRTYLGAKRYFPGNATEILDFLARLALRRLSEGRRVLFVSKKVFKPFCATELRARFEALGHGDITVVEQGYDQAALDGLRVVPIIHYGMVGVNDFQEFDAVYCLNSFYIYSKMLDEVLQDQVGADGYIELEIRNSRVAGRSAGTRHVRDRVYDLEFLSTQGRKALETDMVIQAIGRVRPFTKPREVITFQADDMAEELPGVTDFRTLAEARLHFDITTPREERCASMIAEVSAMKAAGLKQKQVAGILNVAARTVQRYWHQQPAQLPPQVIGE
jgi:hypothetical protein